MKLNLYWPKRHGAEFFLEDGAGMEILLCTGVYLRI